MVAEKRQIETHREDSTGTNNGAQRGAYKAEKGQQKGRRDAIRGGTETGSVL